LDSIFESNFGISNSEAGTISSKLNIFLKDLKKEISLVVETKYVDKVYRDSYYCYYSTKLKLLERECIKISLFDIGNIQPEHWYDVDYLTLITQKYLGFIVIRPTLNNPIGRNVISPNALINNDIKTCLTDIQTSVLGLKLSVAGFPHSSQDTETMTCAETAIWSLMEYFGNKYPEYKPILPSRILKTLESVVSERQIPSRGLSHEDISYILTKQGFGTVVYSQESYSDKEVFRKIFSCYIESGIPVVVAISNEVDIYHALLCIGRINVSNTHFDTLIPTKFTTKSLYEWNNNMEKFVFIDDNMPPYQKAEFSHPTAHYHSTNWNSCKIIHFIVPLYHKIYLEANDAIDIANDIALNIVNIKDNSVIKTFLASSRSYRNYIISNRDIDIKIKDLILYENLPKFVWITEISTIENLKRNKVTGTILMDATEKSHRNLASFILACYEQNVYCMTENKLKKTSLDIQFCYDAFDKNLTF
jgi:hypothetical protein